jgi:hypothetical protein
MRESERKRLVELIDECCKEELGANLNKDILEKFAKHLLDNGIVVPKCNPIGVMTDGNEFNSDVYCPYCGNNLSGLYGDEPTPIIQCYGCGKFLDNTKTITREEALAKLKEGKNNG